MAKRSRTLEIEKIAYSADDREVLAAIHALKDQHHFKVFVQWLGDKHLANQLHTTDPQQIVAGMQAHYAGRLSQTLEILTEIAGMAKSPLVDE